MTQLIKTSKWVLYSLPIIAFQITYLIILIQGPTLNYQSTTSHDFKEYIFFLFFYVPYILLSYIYIALCKNNILRFNIITTIILLINILPFLINASEYSSIQLIFNLLKTGTLYWIPLISLFITFHRRYNNIAKVQIAAISLSSIFLIFASIVFMLNIPASNTSFWNHIFLICLTAIFSISYLLWQFKKFTRLWGLTVAFMFAASTILEFGTLMNCILVIHFFIAFIMLGAKLVARHYTTNSEQQEINC